MKEIIYISITSIFLCAAAVVAEEAEYELGVGLMKFQYEEFTDGGVFLDGEYGYIPGAIIKRKQDYEEFSSEWVASIYGNTIDYEGKTWGGVPANTKSIAIIIDTHLKIGMPMETYEMPYIGLGYRYWYREILNGYDANGGPVNGLLEEYYWPYWMLGYSANHDFNDKVNIGFDFRITRMFNAKMDIDFLGYNGYDDKQVNLGNRTGVRFALPVKFKKYSFILSPYYEVIDIGKSNSVIITRDGIPVPVTGCTFPCQIEEPRSKTRNIGVEVTWLW